MIKLDCGIEVYIKEFYFGGNYEGQLFGWPDEERHKEMILELPSLLSKKMNFSSNFYNIEPEIKIEDGQHRIPWYHCGVYLESSNRCGRADADLTYMFVCFHSDDLVSRSIEEIVFEQVHAIDWAYSAQSFDFSMF